MADITDQGPRVSPVARVPLEIWTQIIGEVHTSTLPELKEDWSYSAGGLKRPTAGVTDQMRLWATGRRVSRIFKAATEAAFAKALFPLTLPRVRIPNPLFLRVRCFLPVCSYDPIERVELFATELVRLELDSQDDAGKTQQQRVVWKAVHDEYWDIYSKYCLRYNHPMARGWCNCCSPSGPKKAFISLTRKMKNFYKGFINMPFPTDIEEYAIPMEGLKVDLDRREMSFPWVPALNTLFRLRISDNWLMLD